MRFRGLGSRGFVAGGSPAFGALGTHVTMEGTASASLSSTLSNIAVGDLVIALVQRNMEPSITGVAVSGTPMSKVRTIQSGQADFNLGVWALRSSSAISSATITATFADSAMWGSMVTARWSGISSATPLASSCNTAGCAGLTSAATTRTAVQITTTQSALVLGVGTDWNNYATHTAANGFTKRFDNAIAGGGIGSVQFIHEKIAGAGNFGGAANFATVASDDYLSALLAFA